ncbi:Molybdopterin converting factor, small subunit [Paramagnetospirillum magneticum AMB-1]|uniref:Molybdopterin synthase sulfur carrier subunit n=1 Tax=Paramagnetospirillum magneticum (strain ATCC 700264 / AMB-1) TaxID=342108 RepID=Q2W0M5_PARM1|nr:Molybdopterin converting factor, small subunit [Paramagnetospirillum magneticum AMB-1]
MLYFAWLKAKTGVGEEDVAPPAEVATVGQLVAFLKTRSPGHAAAFEVMSTVRVAVNQDYGNLDTPVKAGDEVAFFPPVTGG